MRRVHAVRSVSGPRSPSVAPQQDACGVFEHLRPAFAPRQAQLSELSTEIQRRGPYHWGC